MNIKLSDVIIFAAGAIVGSVVTWKIAKAKYEQIIEEVTAEEDELDDDYVYEDEEESDENDETNAINDMRRAYTDIARQAGYIKEEKEDKPMNASDIYVIAPDDFDTNDYETESLNYYADGVLTDQYDNPIDNPEELIGDIEPFNHFGEYEDDTVHVRNDVTKCDYEILRDTRNFKELLEEE